MCHSASSMFNGAGTSVVDMYLLPGVSICLRNEQIRKQFDAHERLRIMRLVDLAWQNDPRTPLSLRSAKLPFCQFSRHALQHTGLRYTGSSFSSLARRIEWEKAQGKPTSTQPKKIRSPTRQKASRAFCVQEQGSF